MFDILLVLLVQGVPAQPRFADSTIDPPATQPAKMAPRLLLAEGAPDFIREWFYALPTYRIEYIRTLEQQLVDDDKANAESIANAKARLEAIYDEVLPRNFSDGPLGRRSSVSASARSAKKQRVDNQKKEIAALQKKRLADREATEKLIADLKADPVFIHIPTLVTPKVGDFGLLAGPIDVLQIVDDQNLIGQVGEIRVWISQLDTRPHTDDSVIRLEDPVAVIGTKRYTTVLGGTMTILHVQPVKISEYVRRVGG